MRTQCWIKTELSVTLKTGRYQWIWDIKKKKNKSNIYLRYADDILLLTNFGKFIHQFQPETKTLIRKLERI